MDTSNPQPPTDPANDISDDEVEQLLQQAESLVDEIAETTSADAAGLTEAEPTPEEPIEAEAALPSAVTALETPELDAEQAIEETDQINRELAHMLDGLPPEPTTEVAAAEQPLDEPSAPQEGLDDAIINEIIDELDSGLAKETAATEQGERTEPETAMASASPDEVPAVTESVAQAEPAEVPKPAVAPVESAASTAAKIEAPPPASTSTESPPAVVTPSESPSPAKPTVKIPLKARFASLGRAIISALLVVPITIVNFVVRLLVLLDRPFARLAPETKLRIGLVSLVTIFMGATVWVLPRVTARNPYLEMDAPTRTENAQEGSHEGAPPESEHESAPKGEHH